MVPTLGEILATPEDQTKVVEAAISPLKSSTTPLLNITSNTTLHLLNKSTRHTAAEVVDINNSNHLLSSTADTTRIRVRDTVNSSSTAAVEDTTRARDNRTGSKAGGTAVSKVEGTMVSKATTRDLLRISMVGDTSITSPRLTKVEVDGDLPVGTDSL